VPRIRLYVQQSLRISAGAVIDPAGSTHTLPFLRVVCFLRIDPAPFVAECYIDTAAPLTVFPLVQWRQFAGQIEWLTPVSGAPSWLTTISGKTGGSAPCRVGRVCAVAFDCERPPQQLPPVEVIGLFEQAQSGDDRILIGLHASILAGRELNLKAEQRDAWLEQP
jgi:hypothetical protein